MRVMNLLREENKKKKFVFHSSHSNSCDPFTSKSFSVSVILRCTYTLPFSVPLYECFLALFIRLLQDGDNVASCLSLFQRRRRTERTPISAR